MLLIGAALGAAKCSAITPLPDAPVYRNADDHVVPERLRRLADAIQEHRNLPAAFNSLGARTGQPWLSPCSRWRSPRGY